MSVETWKAIFDLGSVVLIGLTFLFGAGALVTGNILNESQKTELAQLKLESANAEKGVADANQKAGDANERARKLEKEAAELTSKNLQLEAIIAPRRLNAKQQEELESLTVFAGRTVEIRSYSLDTEGMVLATQIANALAKSRISLLDNRLTMQPAGSISSAVSVEGTDKALEDALTKAFSTGDNDLTKGASPITARPGFSVDVSFGAVELATPPAAVITVGVKPLK